MLYDYSKLLGRITEKFGNSGTFAQKMELSERTMSLKLNNKVDFKQSEIKKAGELLEIPFNEIEAYFFTEKVQ